MTFLEYVLRKYIGPPVGGYFKCPHCNRRNPSILVNKPKAGCKIKWRCVNGSCPVYKQPQDEYDIMRLYHPEYRYPVHREMVAELRREYRDSIGADEAHTETSETQTPTQQPGPHDLSSPRGQHRAAVDADYVRLHKRVEEEWGEWLAFADELNMRHEELCRRMREMYDRGHFRDLGWFMPNLLNYWERFIEWTEAIDAAHMTECTDPHCDWCCCRAARGLPPLPQPTPEERHAERLRREEEFNRIFEEVARQMKESAAERDRIMYSRRNLKPRF